MLRIKEVSPFFVSQGTFLDRLDRIINCTTEPMTRRPVKLYEIRYRNQDHKIDSIVVDELNAINARLWAVESSKWIKDHPNCIESVMEIHKKTRSH